MPSLHWPFRITVDDHGLHRASPIGFPNCEGIGTDMEAAKKAGSTALSFVFDSGIASVPGFVPDLPAVADMDDGSVTPVRIELQSWIRSGNTRKRVSAP